MKLTDLYPAILTLLMVGIVLGLGIYILTQVGDNLATTAGTVTNESGLWINITPSTVDYATADGFNTFALTSCYANATGAGTLGSAGTLIASGNYSTVADTGAITNATSLNYDDVNCSYTYLYGTEASAVVDTTKTATATFADWLAIIVVVIAAAIVLGIVLSNFSGRRNPSV